jgi:hypothetical protein
MNEVLNGHARRKHVALAQFQYPGNGLLSLGVPGTGGYECDFQIKTAQENLPRKLVCAFAFPGGNLCLACLSSPGH